MIAVIRNFVFPVLWIFPGNIEQNNHNYLSNFQVTGSFNDYYRDALRLLGCMDISQLPSKANICFLCAETDIDRHVCILFVHWVQVWMLFVCGNRKLIAMLSQVCMVGTIQA